MTGMATTTGPITAAGEAPSGGVPGLVAGAAPDVVGAAAEPWGRGGVDPGGGLAVVAVVGDAARDRWCPASHGYGRP
jgi:hypothetical protein